MVLSDKGQSDQHRDKARRAAKLPAGRDAPASGAATGRTSLPLRCRRHSSNRWITTKKHGTKTTARQVDASIPVATVIPNDLRALAPAPVAMTSGTTPRMKANEVIR